MYKKYIQEKSFFLRLCLVLLLWYSANGLPLSRHRSCFCAFCNLASAKQEEKRWRSIKRRKTHSVNEAPLSHNTYEASKGPRVGFLTECISQVFNCHTRIIDSTVWYHTACPKQAGFKEHILGLPDDNLYHIFASPAVHPLCSLALTLQICSDQPFDQGQVYFLLLLFPLIRYCGRRTTSDIPEEFIISFGQKALSANIFAYTAQSWQNSSTIWRVAAW